MAGTRRILAVPFARNADGGTYCENFLVSAVITVLVIRFYLEATGYPQIGGGGLHIAHMLWGGLLMLLSMIMLIALLGRSILHIASIAGGIGFGLFIDELGKFITTDNNYLFQPTIALLYILFMLLFVWFRSLQRRARFGSDEYLANAVDLIKEAVLNDLDEAEKERAVFYLDRVDAGNPVAAALRAVLTQAQPRANPRQSLPMRIAARARRFYFGIVEQRWFPTALVVVFALDALASLVTLAVRLTDDPQFGFRSPNFGLADLGDSAGSLLSAVLTCVGILALRRSRAAGDKWFKRSILVSIFLTQVFAFYNIQLYAVISLIADVLLLVALDYMIAQDAKRTEAAPTVSTLQPVPA